MRKYEQPGGVIVRIAVCLFVVAYIGVQSIFLIALRTFDGNQTGMAALVSLILVVKMSDTGAYTFGRLFGKRKLAPKLSPGKTIAGAIGGLATGCAASCVFFQWIAPAMTGDAGSGAVWGPLLYGAILTIAGMIGDLSESLIKRDMEQKDSSTWMPGLGGVLDVIDSLLVAAPIAYLCWAAELVPG
jgi:phosphatidate cytidylyltransferase